MKLGELIMTDKVQHRGFSNRDFKASFKAKPGALMVYMYMGAITPESRPHYKPDGVLAAMGYGPIQTTICQRKVTEALRDAREHIAMDAQCSDAALAPYDAALDLADNHYASSTEVAGAIMLDASRFDKLRRIVAGKVGGLSVLHQLLGAPDTDTQGEDAAGALDAVVDAAAVP